MQLLVLGMHRSGTSMVAGAIARMGAATGPPGEDLGASEENPRGFFERRDVVDLDHDILAAAGADWHRPARFDAGRISGSTRRSLLDRAARIARELDAARPWVIKDPRLSLTLPIWREVLETPVAVIVHRHPVEVAESLRVRNDFPAAFGIALWERYSLAALENTHGMPRILVSYNEWTTHPERGLARLRESLANLGVAGLESPDVETTAEIVDRALHRNRAASIAIEDVLNGRQVALARSLVDGSALESPAPKPSEGGRLALEQYEAELDAAIASTHESSVLEGADGGTPDLRSGMSSRYRRLEVEFLRLFDARESTKERLVGAEDAYRRARERITQLEETNDSLRARLERAEDAYRRARAKRDDALAAYGRAKRRAAQAEAGAGAETESVGSEATEVTEAPELRPAPTPSNDLDSNTPGPRAAESKDPPGPAD